MYLLKVLKQKETILWYESGEGNGINMCSVFFKTQAIYGHGDFLFSLTLWQLYLLHACTTDVNIVFTAVRFANGAGAVLKPQGKQ